MEDGALLWYLIHPSGDHLLGFSDTTNATNGRGRWKDCGGTENIECLKGSPFPAAFSIVVPSYSLSSERKLGYRRNYPLNYLAD